jgi:glycosyltransferase involved in cell wall biosynthesis
MIAYSFYEGDNRVMRYAEALAARGDQVDVFALGHAGQAKIEMVNGVRLFHIQSRQRNEKSKWSYLFRISMFLLRAFAAVSARHARHPYRLVHVHSIPDFLVFAAAIPRLSGARIILDIHDLSPELYGTKFGSASGSATFLALLTVERLSTAFADHVIAPNHIWYQRLLSRSVAESKCSVFMNYPDPGVFQARGRTRNNGKFVMLYPGTLNWHQGLDVAIRAFAKIKHCAPNLEFHIYGEGPSRDDLIQLAAELGVSKEVSFHRPVSLREVSTVIENADLGIVPKRRDSFGDEAFSTKTLEFMNMGIPIVLAETTVDRYYFNDDVVTFFPSGDDDALAERLLRLVQDDNLRARQAANGRAFVIPYSWDSRKYEYLSLVDQLAGVKRRDDSPATSSHSAMEVRSGARQFAPTDCRCDATNKTAKLYAGKVENEL